MTDFTINSDISLQTVIGQLREDYKAHRYLKGKYRIGKSRSIDQNSISHAWYQQIERELREDSAEAIKRECKLVYGCPILCADDDDFRQFYVAVLKPLTHEQRIEAMRYIDITSTMTKPQLSRYLEAMQKAYQRRGVALEFPEQVAA